MENVKNAGGGIVRARIDSVDAFKMIAAICVVFIHCPFFSYWYGEILDIAARFAVPFFFLASGYFTYQEEFHYRKIGKKAGKVLIIALVSSLLYILIKAITGEEILLYPQESVWKSINYFFCFNLPFLSSEHLWYLYALIYCYLFLLFVQKFRMQKYVKYYVVLALFCNIFLQYAMPVISSVSIYDYDSRNALLTGIPFFSIGYLIRRKNIDFAKIKNIWLVIGIVGGWFCGVLEYILFQNMGDLYIGTIFYSVSVFCFALKNKSFGKGALSFCGREYSLLLYILHPVVRSLFNLWFGGAAWYAAMPQWLYPLVILALSFAVSVAVKSIFILIQKVCRSLRRKKAPSGG